MKTFSQTLLYDGSFTGYLSCIFFLFDRRLKQVRIRKVSRFHQDMFSDHQEVLTNDANADRVHLGLKKRLGEKKVRDIYAAFLSEHEQVEDLLTSYILEVFRENKSSSGDYGNLTVLGISQLTRMTRREAHRMEAFVRFKLTKDKIYYANIAPDFDVIPLISRHFEDRYADQRWLIYDLKRKYGIYYDLTKVETVQISFSQSEESNQSIFDPSESDYQKLWKDYFESTHIKARKNMRLHLQHVPKRYWRYLSEKGGSL